MGQRMFVAVYPPEPAREDLEEFLAPRRGMPWISSELWHLTLTFCASVPEHRIDEFADRLGEIAERHSPMELQLGGAGVFPVPERAKVFWCGVAEHGATDDGEGTPLYRLARSAKGVANDVGGAPDGKPFHPHLTLARLTRPIEATKWLRVLDTYRGPTWRAEEIHLVASYLNEGPNRRPRHETVARLPLGRGR